MKKITTVVLIIIMLLSLVSCASSKESIIGSWNGFFTQTIETEDENDEDFVLKTDFVFKFNQDDTCSITLDLEKAKTDIYNHFDGYIQNIIAEKCKEDRNRMNSTQISAFVSTNGFRTLEDYYIDLLYLQDSEYETYEELIQSYVNLVVESGKNGLFKSEVINGTYTVSGSDIVITSDGNQRNTAVYNVKEDTITWHEGNDIITLTK